MRDRAFSVYIVASRSRTLYIGVTSNIESRVRKHKLGIYDGFSKMYRCTRLVWFERCADADTAIQREKQLKRWSREKKLHLIQSTNPTWIDLGDDWRDPYTPARSNLGRK